MTQVIQPPGWPRPRGYANGIVASGRLLAIAGQVGWDEHERIVSKDFVAQFVRALDNVLSVVTAAGGSPRDIVSLTVFVTDRLQYQASTPEIGQAWQIRMGRHFPAMALVEVKGLLEPDALIEIQGLAVLP
jgi:enamine deaminase RidA (YjgF/YER057c/UK114 family)